MSEKVAALADWIEVNTPKVMANRDDRAAMKCRVASPTRPTRNPRSRRPGKRSATRHNHRYLLKST
ncbi:MAG: hypothetical protein ACLR9P_00955 [Escherichia coli]